MPKPMKVKFFMGSTTGELEERINAWLDHLSAASIIRTETRVATVEEKPDDGNHPCIVVTIWYELSQA
ncbi:hypothetical protein [Bradyrhizobium sp.]|jgi:hypothetical protein|uniref:hypothetical protein n=1 Tax=Bradyrhizobium sp. TaxID=376 RepID=UPI003C18EE25